MAEATELNCAQLQNSELALLPLHGAIRYHPKTSHDVVFDQASGNIVVWTSALDGEKWAYSDYGKRMDQLLCDRGQVVSESYQPAIVPFSLPLDDDDDTDKRVDLLEKWNLNHSHYLSLHDRPLKIQAALRILCLDTADLEHFAKSQSNPFDSLSDHYELKVKKMFSSIASEKLDNVLSLQVSQSNSPRFDKLKRELIQKYKDKVIKVLEYNLNEFGSTSNCTNESA
ncbi:uncharacterized protein LOC126325805 [Schistocerca gregaria]|uniref:uncharacterized protein LOC126325805 n=1 Tax=Schistocerca gregaria TaxID=7010 RepID=UPI00211DD16C|nr:uncharacterized protein LOC126325805 [Schistocerca gregaria]